MIECFCVFAIGAKTVDDQILNILDVLSGKQSVYQFCSMDFLHGEQMCKLPPTISFFIKSTYDQLLPFSKMLYCLAST